MLQYSLLVVVFIVSVGSLFGDVVLVANLAIILSRKRESWLLYLNCNLAGCVLCFFLMVPCLDLQFVIVAYPGHTHILGKRTQVNACADPESLVRGGPTL